VCWQRPTTKEETVPDPILHQYAMSPFSEKIRAIFGFKRLAWRAVDIPSILPKPDLLALTGGYRRTPVLQVGADIYCDTELIARVLETLAPEPPLYPPQCAAATVALARWADSALFLAAAVLFSQREVLEYVFAGHEDLRQSFIADRIAMRKGAPGRRPSLTEARVTVESFVRQFDTQMSLGTPWLLGSAPTIADFSVYHALWFVRGPAPLRGLLAPFTHVAQWMLAMHALRHGTPTPMSAAEAIAVAHAAAPAPAEPMSDTPEFAPGAPVEVLPTDYALDPVAGSLVRLNTDEIAVRRTDPRAGEVVVHFPRIGYEIRAAG
jgi:glutathione S-transferase